MSTFGLCNGVKMTGFLRFQACGCPNCGGSWNPPVMGFGPLWSSILDYIHALVDKLCYRRKMREWNGFKDENQSESLNSAVYQEIYYLHGLGWDSYSFNIGLCRNTPWRMAQWIWGSFKSLPSEICRRCTMTTSVEEQKTNSPYGRMWKHFKESCNATACCFQLCHYFRKQNADLISCYIIFRLRPRILVDVSKIDMSTTLLGYNMSSPILVAPTGSQQLAHPQGFDLTLSVMKHKLCM